MARKLADDICRHNIYGRISREEAAKYGGINEVVLHDLYGVCSKCGKMKPLSDFGLLTDKHGNCVRNQPQCRECRGGA